MQMRCNSPPKDCKNVVMMVYFPRLPFLLVGAARRVHCDFSRGEEGGETN